MSYPPPYGPPPPNDNLGWQVPSNPPYPTSDYGLISQPQPPMPIYVPSVIVPVPVASQMPQVQIPQMPTMPQIPTMSQVPQVPPIVPMPQIPQSNQSQSTYVRNIHHGQLSGSEEFQVTGYPEEYDWVLTTPTTATNLAGRAVVGGKDSWDGSPLWVIRGWHRGNLMPGSLSLRKNKAYVTHDGNEVSIGNIEVLCAKPDYLKWLPAANGNVPPGAVVGGKTTTGEPLYVGRAIHQLSVIPGKIHPAHGTCYVGFGGTEVACSHYDVLCRLS
ncbi:uncharacterized protein LOC123665139 [Melitaea cinxia]|uniref:uncharacterized protein LOC123665139 n=1 Tax=Melitaea cinxia TaxID=113334 RepID=UPI001E27496F|nr:uncharacterized protein LOC123665139 [Melitaea cinxia]